MGTLFVSSMLVVSMVRIVAVMCGGRPCLPQVCVAHDVAVLLIRWCHDAFSTEIYYPGLSHGITATHPDLVNRDLLAFCQQGQRIVVISAEVVIRLLGAYGADIPATGRP
jgi:hypothetical protein